MGSWELRPNSNVEDAYLCKFLDRRGVAKPLIDRAVADLKRSTVSVAEGIRQNLDNQQEALIRPIFN